MLPIKLYKENNGEVKEILNDDRVRLLNDDTGDTLGRCTDVESGN